MNGVRPVDRRLNMGQVVIHTLAAFVRPAERRALPLVARAEP